MLRKFKSKQRYTSKNNYNLLELYVHIFVLYIPAVRLGPVLSI